MIIYVEENRLTKNGPISIKGVMNEGRFEALYTKEALKILKEEKKYGDAIGQGQYVYSEIITSTPCQGSTTLYLNEHPEIYF